MKNKFKLSALCLMTTLMSGMVHAADPVTISAPEKVKEGNTFEKELTPLLREISKKKSQLELRKLERELAKIDEDEVKAQLEIEAKNNPTPSMGGEVGPMGGMVGGSSPLGLPGMPTMGVPQAPQAPQGKKSEPEEEQPVYADVRVLMIYGFDGDLSAKVATGAQGGYVVKKGDVMPDGRKVTKITSNYIEVKPVKGNKLSKGVSRIFVSGGEQTATTGSTTKDMASGSQDATSLPPSINSLLPGKSPSQLAADSAAAMNSLSPADRAAVQQVQSSFKALDQGVKQIK